MKSILLIVVVGFIPILGSVYAQFDTEGIGESVNSYFDKFSYLCLNLENLGGLEEDNDQVDQKTKNDCNDLLKNMDYFKKKELIKKYGELDN